MKKIFILAGFATSMLLSSSLFAGIVDVRFTNPNTSGNNFCTTVQVKAQDIAFELGSATVFFSYNTTAIRNPQHTALNFNENNSCAASGSIAPYKNSFNSLESATVGEGNYAILLMYPNQGCPTVQSEWIDVAQFCFEIVDGAAPKGLSFNAQYTAFNTVANNGDQLSIGTLSGLDGSVSVNSPVADSKEVSISPNLTKDKVNIAFDLQNQSSITINVFDILGRTIITDKRTLQSGKHNTDIDLSKFNNGYYLVEVDNGKTKTASKVLLAK